MAKTEWQRAADIVTACGGTVVGRTKLQKVAYLMEVAGHGAGFRFNYKHYGPYSEGLADAIQTAEAFGLISEEERQAGWGGTYSIFRSTGGTSASLGTSERFAQQAANIDSVELELAATAAYLSREGYSDPWQETARRKPNKAAGGRLEKARAAYRELLDIATARPLPRI